MNELVDEYVFKRTTWRLWLLLVLSIAAIALTLTARLMSTEIKTFEGTIVRFTYISSWIFWVFMVLWGSCFVWSIAKIRTARRMIVINRAGISDSKAESLAPIPWSRISDLDLAGTESTGFRLQLTLAGEQSEMTREIDLEGIEPGPEGVFQVALETWKSERGATSAPRTRRKLAVNAPWLWSGDRLRC